MNDFPATLKHSDIEKARIEVLQNYEIFCANNPLLAEIQEAKAVEDLENICRFVHSLSVFLTKVDILGTQYDYAPYLDGLALAVEAKDCALCGIEVTSADYELIAKYGIE